MTSKILSVVVPVFNFADHVEHLETELSKLHGPDVQIILVDDGSTDGTAAALADLKAVWNDISLVNCPENGGAGAARNAGFRHATGTYTFFFDADDLLHLEAVFQTIDALESSGADASINLYEFIRDGSHVTTGMNAIDGYIWKRHAARLIGRPFHISECPEFLRFTNFPWNKLVRTAHYRELDLVPFFGETRVNNDILGHWNILLNARKLIALDQKIVTHRISGAREHLSTQFGEERLELFSALQTLYDTLKAEPDRLVRYGNEYWMFVQQMVTWAGSRLDDKHRGSFERMHSDLVSQISFAELHDLMRAGDRETYRWLLDSIG